MATWYRREARRQRRARERVPLGHVVDILVVIVFVVNGEFVNELTEQSGEEWPSHCESVDQRN